MSCHNCFTDYLSNCGTTLTINTILHSTANYKWVITDKFDQKYSGDVISNADGGIVIQTSELPDGFLNNYAGDFKLEIQDATCKPIKFLIASEYDCIGFTVKGGTFVKDEIGCFVDCVTPVS